MRQSIIGRVHSHAGWVWVCYGCGMREQAMADIVNIVNTSNL
jgi:hypothetical protein